MSTEYQFDLETEPKKANILVRAFRAIPRKAKIVACILGVTVLAVSLLAAFKPEAQKRAIPETVVRVDAISATRSTYPIIVNANGTIEAETRGNLVAQISGEIVATSDNFKTGGSFKKGEVLIEIDPRDFQAEASRALANLSRAQANFRSEQANAKQAKQDWERLGNTEPAPDLVLRKPQLTAAQAELDSARAAHDTAKLNLSRTKITAPYDGRIIDRRAVLGQYLTLGSPIAEVFAVDGVEVRLPISQEEFSQLGLDSFSSNSSDQDYSVVLSSQVGGEEYRWNARITRTDSTFDINTRQIDIIAEVQDPFSRNNVNSGQPPLKIGQFVAAQITGRSVDDVFVIPNKSIREGSYVYVIRDGKLTKQGINILWQDDQNALLSEGLNNEELVVTTSLNSTLAGATAKLPDGFNAQAQTPLAAAPSPSSDDTDFTSADQTATDAPSNDIADELTDSADDTAQGDINQPSAAGNTSAEATPASNSSASQ